MGLVFVVDFNYSVYNKSMLEIRPILEQIAKLEERETALRGYL